VSCVCPVGTIENLVAKAPLREHGGANLGVNAACAARATFSSEPASLPRRPVKGSSPWIRAGFSCIRRRLGCRSGGVSAERFHDPPRQHARIGRIGSSCALAALVAAIAATSGAVVPYDVPRIITATKGDFPLRMIKRSYVMDGGARCSRIFTKNNVRDIVRPARLRREM
jgi:hypothetical protein